VEKARGERGSSARLRIGKSSVDNESEKVYEANGQGRKNEKRTRPSVRTIKKDGGEKELCNIAKKLLAPYALTS